MNASNTQKYGAGRPAYANGRVMTLTYDVTRCMAVKKKPVGLCPERETCARYTMRAENLSKWTVIEFYACRTQRYEQKVEVKA